MKQKFLKMLEELKLVDVANTPVVRFKTFLLGRLLRDQVPVAPILVGNMKVEINEEFINDSELVDAAVDAYATVLKRTWATIQQMPMNPPDQLVFFVDSSKGLSLTYTS